MFHRTNVYLNEKYNETIPPILDDELKNAIFSFAGNKTTGPDGIQALFKNYT